jgi:ligand-binding sensor domain-containing protein
LAGDDVLALCVSTDGTVWAAVWEMHATGYVGCGVSFLAPDGTWSRLTTAHGLPSNNVRALAIAADGSLWVGTGEENHHSGEGAARRDPQGNWERYTITQGLPTNYVEQICVAPDGSTWIITHDFVRRALRLFPDGRRFVYTERDGLVHAWVNAITVAADGAIWFGTAQGASRLGPNQRWTSYGVGDGLTHATVVAVASGPDGAVWFGTPAGLCRLGPDGQWSAYSTGPQRPDHHIYSLCAAPDGSAWAATVSGLFNFRPVAPLAHAGVDNAPAGRPICDAESGRAREACSDPNHVTNANTRDQVYMPRRHKPVAPGGLAEHLAYHCRTINHRRFWRGRGIHGAV